MDIEMENLSKKTSSPTKNSKEISNSESEESLSSWALTSAFICAIISLVLVAFPRLLLFFAENANEPEPRTALTPLEHFLALHSGIWLASIAVALILNIPGASSGVHRQEASTHPLLVPVFVASSFASLAAWNTSSVGSLATIISVLEGIVSLWGLWTLLFGFTSSYSKKTGADKHTSAFIFGNKSAASSKKKEWERDHKGR